MLTTQDREAIELYMIGRVPECPIMGLMRKAYMELLRIEDLDRHCREHPTKQETDKRSHKK